MHWGLDFVLIIVGASVLSVLWEPVHRFFMREAKRTETGFSDYDQGDEA